MEWIYLWFFLVLLVTVLNKTFFSILNCPYPTTISLVSTTRNSMDVYITPRFIFYHHIYILESLTTVFHHGSIS